MRYLLIVLAVVAIFTVFTTVFAASASPKEVRLLPKWAWILICLFVPAIGGILYLATGRPKSSGANSVGGRTVAPDDDPEFLRNLRERLNNDPGEDYGNDLGPDPESGPGSGFDPKSGPFPGKGPNC